MERQTWHLTRCLDALITCWVPRVDPGHCRTQAESLCPQALCHHAPAWFLEPPQPLCDGGFPWQLESSPPAPRIYTSLHPRQAWCRLAETRARKPLPAQSQLPTPCRAELNAKSTVTVLSLHFTLHPSSLLAEITFKQTHPCLKVGFWGTELRLSVGAFFVSKSHCLRGCWLYVPKGLLCRRASQSP